VDIRWRVLNLGSKSKKSSQFFFPCFLKKEIKEFKTPKCSFLVLEAKHYNSKTTFTFCSIKLSKGAKLILSLNFKLVDMAKFNASFNNEWPLDWFQNTNGYNSTKGINNNLRCVSCQWRWYSCGHPHIIFSL